MRFKDFIFGKDAALDPVKLVRDNCQQFLRLGVDQPLYRGETNRWFEEPVVLMSVRKDRKPRDTEQHIHALMDDWFDKKCGVRLRPEALFCSSSPDIATQYGPLHYVFPAGSFRYFWAAGIEGIEPKYENRPLKDTLVLSGWIKDRTRVKPALMAPEITDSILSRVKWKTGGLAQALEDEVEIAVVCDKAVMVTEKLVEKKYGSYQDFLKLVRRQDK